VFGFSTKLPVDDDARAWVDEGFSRLERMLGRSRMLEAEAILPEPEYFPDPYDKSPDAAKALFHRICAYMRADPDQVELEFFPDETEELREILPHWSGGSDGCAGLYYSRANPGHDEKNGADHKDRMLIALSNTLLKEPITLIATVAHELGHVILLGGGLMDQSTPDHEPMTDLLTVFLGFGIFTANAAAHFSQFQDERRQGWSMRRLGYLSQETYGYALAKFAAERSEPKPDWVRHLSTNVRSYFKQSRAWLAKNRAR
jgi:hypothetical protein